MPRRVGVVGYGHLGQYLVNAIQNSDHLELAFVWNRSLSALVDKVPQKVIAEDLSDVSKFSPDLIVEVAHPSITEKYGELFLQVADYMVGSPTVMAGVEVERRLRAAASKHGLYVPCGALWGSEDIRRMADLGTLSALKIGMTKHPSSFKVLGEVKERNDQVVDKAECIYKGSVRNLCPLAPNNVNTMAAAALAAHSLGFDGVEGCLISDPELPDMHIVQVDVWGRHDPDSGNTFHCQTVRKNPAAPGAVTGSATFPSFFNSLKAAHGKGPGVHLC